MLTRRYPVALSPHGHGSYQRSKRLGSVVFSPRDWRLYYWPVYVAVPHDSGVGLMRWG